MQAAIYYKGYVIQKISPNHYDLWSRKYAKTLLHPHGRTFIITLLTLQSAKNYIDERR